jgi:hypothetical protein
LSPVVIGGIDLSGDKDTLTGWMGAVDANLPMLLDE